MTTELETLVMRCATCRYWAGDKAKAAAMFEEKPLSMDLFKGWPNTGGCNLEYEWIDIDSNGDACVTIKVDANFGCPYWGA